MSTPLSKLIEFAQFMSTYDDPCYYVFEEIPCDDCPILTQCEKNFGLLSNTDELVHRAARNEAFRQWLIAIKNHGQPELF